MELLRFCLAFAVAIIAASALLSCAPVHDATPSICPADQRPSGGLCVCVSTERAPIDGSCPPDDGTTCHLEDCPADGNPCTEPTCLAGADACSNEQVANFIACQESGAAGMCLLGECIVGSQPWGLGVPFLIGGGSVKASGPLVSIAADGAAVALWVEGDALVASHLDPTEGWAQPRLIDDDVFPDRGFAMDMDAAGNAVVVFVRVDVVSSELRAVRFNDSTGAWGTSETVSRAGSNASQPSVSITPDGEAVAVWADTPNDIVLRRTHTGTLVWDSPVVVSPSDGYVKEAPSVSIEGAGIGAVVYQGGGPDETIEAVWATPLGPAGLVGTSTRIDASSGQVVSVRVAAADDGNVMALWEQDNSIWHAYFTDEQWQPAGLVEVNPADAFGQEVVWDGDGTFVAAWGQGLNVRVRSFSEADQVWDNTDVLAADNNDTGGPPSVRAGSTGESWLVWHKGAFIRMNHSTPDSGWNTGEKLSGELQSDQPALQGPELALSPDGTLVVVWADVNDVWAWVDAP